MCTRTRYLDPYEPTIITADDRMKIVDWCCGVVDHCHFSREVVDSVMDMVDRYFFMVCSAITDEASLASAAVYSSPNLKRIYLSLCNKLW